MKKISLKNLNLREVDQLSGEQLKNVLGGYGSSSDSGGTSVEKCMCSCTDRVGSWPSDDCSSGNSWACGNPHGPYTCVER